MPMDFWQWWVAGVVLLIAEMLLPTYFMMWFAIASFVTGLMLLIFPEMGVASQLGIFAVASVVSAVVVRTYLKRHPLKTDDNTLNRRGNQYVGKTYRVSQAIRDGAGKISIGDSQWRVTANPDIEIPVGAAVTVISQDGITLDVEPLDASNDQAITAEMPSKTE